MNFLSEKQVRWFWWLSWILMVIAGVSAILAGFSVIPSPGSQILGITAAVSAYLARAFEQKLQPDAKKIESPPKAS